MRFLLLLFSLLAVTNGYGGLFFQTAYPTFKSVMACDYPANKQFGVKFFCKYRNLTCDDILSTKPALKKNGTFSLTTTRRGFSVSISKVSPRDEGVYWCGMNEERHRTLMKKIRLKVKAPPPPPTPPVSPSSLAQTEAPPPPPTPPVSTSQSTTSSLAQTDGGSQVRTAVICGAVVMLLSGLILIFICKRSSYSKNSRNEPADQHIREDCVYEEITRRIQTKDSENEMKTVYAMANYPTDPSALLHYSSIDFHHSADKAAGEAVILKSSSACEYSAVKSSHTYCAVGAPSRTSEDPLYSNVNKPK